MEKVIFDRVEKQLGKLPFYIVDKLIGWARTVEMHGLNEVRKIPGYHDEPLTGKRRGQRSIRLSKAYRAIYTVEKSEVIIFIILEEVNKHEY